MAARRPRKYTIRLSPFSNNQLRQAHWSLKRRLTKFETVEARKNISVAFIFIENAFKHQQSEDTSTESIDDIINDLALSMTQYVYILIMIV